MVGWLKKKKVNRWSGWAFGMKMKESDLATSPWAENFTNIYIYFCTLKYYCLILPNHCTSDSYGSNWLAASWSSHTPAIILPPFSSCFCLLLPLTDTPWLWGGLLLYSLWHLLKWCLAHCRHSVNTSEWMCLVVVTSHTVAAAPATLVRRAVKGRERMISIFCQSSLSLLYSQRTEALVLEIIYGSLMMIKKLPKHLESRLIWQSTVILTLMGP